MIVVNFKNFVGFQRKLKKNISRIFLSFQEIKNAIGKQVSIFAIKEYM